MIPTHIMSSDRGRKLTDSTHEGYVAEIAVFVCNFGKFYFRKEKKGGGGAKKKGVMGMQGSDISHIL